MSDNDAWFAPKRYGYGAGLPIAWQGWLVLGLFAGALAGAAMLLLPARPMVFMATALILAIPLTVICARHTRGGWRWRWGGEQ